MFICMRYIELNHVRANMVNVPELYPWSSYQANARGKDNELLSYHPLYQALGSSRRQRIDAYNELFKAHIGEEQLGAIRASWQTGTPLGNDYFKEKIEEKLRCKVGLARRGRPVKAFEPL